MSITHRGVQRLLNALTDRPSGMTCAKCREQLPMLADKVMSGLSPAKGAPEAAAHLDRCPECEELFVELLGDLQLALSGPVVSVGSEPDLSFIPRSPTLNDIWRTALESALEVVRAAAGRLQSVQISLRLPAVLTPQLAPGLLAGESGQEKLLLARTLDDEHGLQIELRAQREPGAAECNLLAEVDSVRPDAPRPQRLVLRSGERTWTAYFDQAGQATIARFPIDSLAQLDLTLFFDD